MNEINLAKSAMLLSVSIKLEGLLGERRDRKASSLVTSTYTVEESRAKASKYLINRKHKSVKGVVAAAQQVRSVVYRYSFPWGDSSLRLLPAKAHDKFSSELNNAMQELRDSIDRYMTFYPYLVAKSEKELGELFDASQYPPTDTVREMFRISVRYMPVPDTGNFVADIANEAANSARQTIIDQTREATHEAFQDIVVRVERTVTAMVDGLSAFRPKESSRDKVEGIFRDSLINNVRDIAGLIDTLNFTNDPKITKLAIQMERLGKFSAEVIRSDPQARNATVSAGQALLNDLIQLKELDTEVDDIVDQLSAYT